MSVEVLECVLCKKRYSRDDILAGYYHVRTLVCSWCYAELQKKPYSQSCFGKPPATLPGGNTIVLQGYDEECEECSTLCPDRIVCRRLARPRKNQG